MDALEGVTLKLDRAEDVIEELHEAIVEYLQENNYEIIGKFEPELSRYTLTGKVTKTTVPFGVTAGDVVHNLRSSLDHLAWQLALLTTTTPYNLTQFPIALTPGEFGSKRGQLMIRDLIPEHRALVERFQPYNGTNRDWTPLALRDLRVLSNTDKHRVLNATVAKKPTKVKSILGVGIIRDATAARDIEWFAEGSIDGAILASMTLEGSVQTRK